MEHDDLPMQLRRWLADSLKVPMSKTPKKTRAELLWQIKNKSAAMYAEAAIDLAREESTLKLTEDSQ